MKEFFKNLVLILAIFTFLFIYELLMNSVEVHRPDDKMICYTYKNNMDCRALFEIEYTEEDLIK